MMTNSTYVTEIVYSSGGMVVLDEEPLDLENYNAADNVEFCSNEGGMCICEGTAWYGHSGLNSSWSECNDDPKACFETMMTYPNAHKMNMKADFPVTCGNTDFGGDPAPGIPKFCMCEANHETPITRCGL
jgi:hypothetical protein